MKLEDLTLGHQLPGFVVEIDRRSYEKVSGGRLVSDRGPTEVEAHHRIRMLGPGCWEFSLELTNRGAKEVVATRLDPVRLPLAEGLWHTSAYRSGWGDEFSPIFGSTHHDQRLQSRSGRSSNGMSPWLGIESPLGGLVATVAYSGNWHLDLLADRVLTAGIATWGFQTVLKPGASLTAPSVVVAMGPDLEEACFCLTEAVRTNWIPVSPYSATHPVEWNHWWPYEDAEVSEQVIRDNAAVAFDLGMEVATVDAGWFGRPDKTSDWQQERGDWSEVNTERFPGGLEQLGRDVRAAGPEIGIWIEAEAVGAKSQLRKNSPHLLAKARPGFRPDPSYRSMTVSIDPDDETFLGYVCLGNEAGRRFVADSLHQLVEKTGARWVKLDFNIDPDLGCVSSEHEHGEADGLLAHYQGLYRVLDEFRAQHPEVILESCASGGLRFDLGIARHVHRMFLSDPDYTDHHLQVFWGASRMIPPASILHWSWSQWRGGYPDARLDHLSLSDEDFVFLLRAAMPHNFGVSLRLSEFDSRRRELVAEAVKLFRTQVLDFVREASVRRLTAQPQRRGEGERCPAFQLSRSPDDHLVVAYRLDDAAVWTKVKLKGLDPGRNYVVSRITEVTRQWTLSGKELMAQGLDQTQLGVHRSVFFRVRSQ